MHQTDDNGDDVYNDDDDDDVHIRTGMFILP